MKRNIYAVWRWSDGRIESNTVEIEGKINHLSVMKAIRDRLDYYKRSEAFTVISWQEEDAFDLDEQSEFWKNY
jgi:hypothetical protein